MMSLGKVYHSMYFLLSGIAVKKGSETRLTVAFHCWKEEYKDVPNKLEKLADPVLLPKGKH